MKSLIENIMRIVKDSNIDSVSIPSISTEIFCFPVKKAAKIICNTIKEFINDNPAFINKTIVFCNNDDLTTETFKEVASQFFKEESQINKNNEDNKNSNKICKKCGKEINEIKHQSKGKHLTTCYKCYEKKKAEIAERRHDDYEKEEVKERKPEKNKKLTKDSDSDWSNDSSLSNN